MYFCSLCFGLLFANVWLFCFIFHRTDYFKKSIYIVLAVYVHHKLSFHINPCVLASHTSKISPYFNVIAWRNFEKRLCYRTQNQAGDVQQLFSYLYRTVEICSQWGGPCVLKCSDILSSWNIFILATKQVEISDDSKKFLSANI